MRIYQRYFKNFAKKKPYGDGKAIWEISLYGIRIKIVDYWNSEVPYYVYKEINRDELSIRSLGQISGKILDIGAQAGMVSIYLAKLFPTSHIYSYEAFSGNYENLLLNLELNNIKNVTQKNLAVTGDGRRFYMICNTDGNTGGSTGWSRQAAADTSNYSVESITLDDVLDELEIVDLLKIDCEGAEHEIIMNARRLGCIKNLIGEFHINDRLRSTGYTIEGLESKVRKSIDGHVRVKKIEMCQ